MALHCSRHRPVHQILIVPNPIAEVPDLSIVEAVVQDSGVPNAVSGIIFRNRLYDTIFEVIVFTIAIMGAQFLLANERPFCTIYQFTDQTSVRTGTTRRDHCRDRWD
jgi:multicomponent Na+:H+ antiporter subunit B